MADISRRGDIDTRVVDATNQYSLKVTSAGSINVNSNVGGLPDIPEGSSRVSVTAAPADVATTAGVDYTYTITNTKVLTIQTFSGGAEGATGGSAVDLYYDPNGTGVGMTWIETLFVNGSSANAGISNQYTGDGTRRILMRLRGYTTNAREMSARWYGYEL